MPASKTHMLPSEKEVARAARMYHTSTTAAKALSINSNTFNDLCLKYKVETPAARRARGG